MTHSFFIKDAESTHSDTGANFSRVFDLLNQHKNQGVTLNPKQVDDLLTEISNMLYEVRDRQKEVLRALVENIQSYLDNTEKLSNKYSEREVDDLLTEVGNMLSIAYHFPNIIELKMLISSIKEKKKSESKYPRGTVVR